MCFICFRKAINTAPRNKYLATNTLKNEDFYLKVTGNDQSPRTDSNLHLCQKNPMQKDNYSYSDTGIYLLQSKEYLINNNNIVTDLKNPENQSMLSQICYLPSPIVNKLNMGFASLSTEKVDQKISTAVVNSESTVACFEVCDANSCVFYPPAVVHNFNNQTKKLLFTSNHLKGNVNDCRTNTNNIITDIVYADNGNSITALNASDTL